VAEGYQTVTPGFVDQGITNFFSNVHDIGVVANDLLQFKLLQAGQDTGRFLLNSTFGLAGFMDVARTVSLPKHNEDLDQTLGAWGLPSGPYLVLPFLGPSTPRGTVGLAGDIASNPINWINPVWIPWAAGVTETVDLRADLLSATKIMDEASVDRYEFMRNAYLQQRNYLVHDGNPPVDEELEAEFDIEGLDTEESSSEPEEPVPPSEPGTPLPHY
jgi:phospholipid-binding lipoprotein MlaA